MASGMSIPSCRSPYPSNHSLPFINHSPTPSFNHSHTHSPTPFPTHSHTNSQSHSPTHSPTNFPTHFPTPCQTPPIPSHTHSLILTLIFPLIIMCTHSLLILPLISNSFCPQSHSFSHSRYHSFSHFFA